MLFIFVFLVTLIINFLTLYLVVRKSKAKKGIKVLIKNPAFLLGDFFLIPLYFVFARIFLTDNASLLQKLNPAHFLIIVVISGLVTSAFGKKFNLLRKVWIPHGIFHSTIVFSFLLMTLVTALNNWRDGTLVAIMLSLLFFHQFLGILYSKRLE